LRNSISNFYENNIVATPIKNSALRRIKKNKNKNKKLATSAPVESPSKKSPSEEYYGEDEEDSAAKDEGYYSESDEDNPKEDEDEIKDNDKKKESEDEQDNDAEGDDKEEEENDDAESEIEQEGDEEEEDTANEEEEDDEVEEDDEKGDADVKDEDDNDSEGENNNEEGFEGDDADKKEMEGESDEEKNGEEDGSKDEEEEDDDENEGEEEENEGEEDGEEIDAENEGDDSNESEGENNYEDGESQNEVEVDPTNAPTTLVTDAPILTITTNAPVAVVNFFTDAPSTQYISSDDDPIMAEELAQQLKEEEKAEINKVENEAKAAGGIGFMFALLAMVFTAYQMSENPDGIYASVCRLCMTVVCCGLKMLLIPCRNFLPGNNRYHAGHIPVSTMEYREPYQGGHKSNGVTLEMS